MRRQISFLLVMVALVLVISVPTVASELLDLTDDALAETTSPSNALSIYLGDENIPLSWALISDNAFQNASGIISVIQVTGNGNIINLTANFYIDIFFVDGEPTFIINWDVAPDLTNL